MPLLSVGLEEGLREGRDGWRWRGDAETSPRREGRPGVDPGGRGGPAGTEVSGGEHDEAAGHGRVIQSQVSRPVPSNLSSPSKSSPK